MSVEYYPTRHAVTRMADRQISWAEVLEVLTAPEVTYIQARAIGNLSPGRVNQRGDLYAVTSLEIEDAGHTDIVAVMTVGLRSQDQWTDEDARNRKKS